MNTRHHELKIGEIVFDYEKRLWGRLLEINGKTAKVGQRDLLKRNIVEIDTDAEKDSEEWTTGVSNLYQQVEDKTDEYGWNICWEHLTDEYSYYSPSKDENLYECEVFS
jgi:hypothetical protein